MKNTAVAITVIMLSACNNMTFHSNIDEYMVSSHLARKALYEFKSGQQAIESGATLLGSTEGMSCLNKRVESVRNDESAWLKDQAIENLKLDALALGGNAYLLEQCKRFNYRSYDCEQAYICTGQAYDYQ